MTESTTLTSKVSGFHLPMHGTDSALHHAHIIVALDSSIPIRSENGASNGASAALNTYAFDAYGVMLGQEAGAEQKQATSLLYAGEQFDVGLQQYYL